MASAALTALSTPARATETDERERSGMVLKSDLSYERVYEANFDFVWRNARRLGASDVVIDDVVQDVFLVVHRRLPQFEARSSMRTWLFGILLKVAKDYRRSEKRRVVREQASVEIAMIEAPESVTPEQSLSKKEAANLVLELLDALDDDKRTIFVLVELEQMSVAEAAQILELNPNTAHARLRAARQTFEQALARHRARAKSGGKR